MFCVVRKSPRIDIRNHTNKEKQYHEVYLQQKLRDLVVKTLGLGTKGLGFISRQVHVCKGYSFHTKIVLFVQELYIKCAFSIEKAYSSVLCATSNEVYSFNLPVSPMISWHLHGCIYFF